MSHSQLVVHVKRAPFDVYVGRPAKPTPHHYGNPFSNRGGTKAAEVVDDPITEFRHWLHGIAHQELEPDRRAWIIRTLPSLAGKVLGCWCITPENPHAECHGRVLADFARWVEGYTPEQAWQAYNQPLAPARAIGSTVAPVAQEAPVGRVWLERNGKRVHLACVLGEDLDEARQLSAQLHELKRMAGL